VRVAAVVSLSYQSFDLWGVGAIVNKPQELDHFALCRGEFFCGFVVGIRGGVVRWGDVHGVGGGILGDFKLEEGFGDVLKVAALLLDS